MINVAILGSTGSIGTQTLDVLKNLPGFRVYGLSAYRSIEKLSEQISEYIPQKVVVNDPEAAKQLKQKYNIETASGREGLIELASDPEVDVVVMALVGFAGLEPTIAALEAGKKVALANKETLVVGGHLVMEHRSQIIPIDSEHSAIWQIMDGKNPQDIDAVILTASGGPFLSEPEDLSQVTVDQALKHPTWNMGGKITIDSATLMNKGLEVIEAHWLFNLDYDKIEVIIHPQSIIHSMVRFRDGSVLAQLGPADMRMPIQYALTYPRTVESQVSALDFSKLTALTFSDCDSQRFPCLELAYQAGRIGGTMTTVLNAANEVAVNLFLKNKICFTHIPEIVQSAMNKHSPVMQPSLAELIAVDREARAHALRISEILGRMG
ncbi:MAG: 1-deoxy-D-xylulose-5-phosphate reductoisomerase [Candidatus Wallacebacter cryptica]|jgi:1-deoxy-D-xylulose-5-phosphate reductoisomerase|nr:1-deoxy-D-xylulose-5-phosphate reductoisomerase [Bacillota bacterium]